MICSSLIYLLLANKTGQNLRAVSLALLCVGCAMAAEAMLIEPWISQRESGRDFVRQTEADIAPTIPVVLYKINPDGDGIKYALYSNRPSEDLSFAHTPAELGGHPLPFVLVAFAKMENEVAMYAHRKSMQEITQGLMHRKNITSWLIGEQKQDIQPGQQLNGAPALGSGD